MSTASEAPVRKYICAHHRRGAELFAAEALRVEQTAGPDPSYEVLTAHASYVIGSVLLSATFLETAINELFADAAEHEVPHLPAEHADMLARLWRRDVPRTAGYGIVEKYQIAMELCRVTPLEEDRAPLQDAQALIKLRNALVHFEPEWIVAEPATQKDAHKLEKALRNRFSLTDIHGKEAPFWPDRCLSHGCASWALDTARAFITEFGKRMQLRLKLDGDIFI